MNTKIFNPKFLNRATIVDGKLLQHFVIDPLSSTDDSILQTVNDLDPTLESVYNTVSSNSAKNWQNSTYSGFSAVKFDNNTELGSSRVAGTLKLESSDRIKVKKMNSNTFTISASEDFINSYYSRAMSQGAYVDDYSVAFNNSSATNYSFAYAINSSATDHGVIFARNKSFASDYGIVYALNSTRLYSSGAATHSSIAIYRK